MAFGWRSERACRFSGKRFIVSRHAQYAATVPSDPEKSGRDWELFCNKNNYIVSATNNSFTTSEAIKRPATEGTKAQLAGTRSPPNGSGLNGFSFE